MNSRKAYTRFFREQARVLRSVIPFFFKSSVVVVVLLESFVVFPMMESALGHHRVPAADDVDAPAENGKLRPYL